MHIRKALWDGLVAKSRESRQQLLSQDPSDDPKSAEPDFWQPRLPILVTGFIQSIIVSIGLVLSDEAINYGT